MVAPGSLMWGGLGEGRACLVPVEKWRSEVSWASHGATANRGMHHPAQRKVGNKRRIRKTCLGKKGWKKGQQGVLVLLW